MTVRFTLPIGSKPKERPRITRKRKAFTPKSTTDVEDAIAEWIDANVDHPGFADRHVKVSVTFRKDSISVWMKPARQRSKLRGDIDNYVKLLLDGLQKSHLIDNDNHVMHVDARKG